MSNPNFIDYVKIYCKSGNGGKGSSHFRREKFAPKGGPDGGDGGRGGNIILKGNKQLWTLLHLKFTKHVVAENGGDGSGSKKYGSNGKDIIIEVPLGTIAKSSKNDKKKLEILDHDEEIILLKGGIGGLGNDHFKSPTNQAPQYSQTGKVGIEEWVILELKVLADVGLVGFPNAGKSTLLSSISKAKPKIGNYPFTTLTPNLGVVPYKDYKSFIVADIPGIIEGASEGKGLGIRFLRHIERNSILLFLIPFDSNIKNEYQLLSNELKKYNKKLLEKKIIVAISKCDLVPKEKIDKINFKSKYPVIKISSITNLGLMELKDCIWKEINSK
jgi:GTP-binding protein